MRNFFIKNSYIYFLALLLWSGCKKENTTPETQPPQQTDSAGEAVPAGAEDGVTFINDGKSAIFNLYAPDKKSVYLIGSFNQWEKKSEYKLTATSDSTRWWIQIDDLDPQKTYTYQYLIDGTLKVADPYSHLILDPVHDQDIPANVYPNIPSYPSGQSGIVSVMQAHKADYNWKVNNFQRPQPKNLVIYELLLRDFVATHSFKTLIDTLDYINRLGVNAIELLPVNEFEGNSSWGYNSNFMFALDKYYGTANDYKAFIDACHARGIAVIQDMVLEDQFGSSPMVQMYWDKANNRPAQNSPWFNTETLHPYGVGFQLNYHDSATVYFSKNVIKYWMKEYHIDGIRFDQAQAFTQTNSNVNHDLWSAYDQDRVNTWTKLNDYIQSLDPHFYVILESFAESKELQALAEQGMMSWANLSFNADQATMGYNDAGGSWDLSGFFYDSWGFPSSIPYNLITYFESHDEVRMQFKNSAYGNANGSYNIKDLQTGLERDAMCITFLLSAPGPKMIWMFGELGYDDATSGPNYGNLNNTGDKRTDPQPIHWDYLQNADRRALYEWYKKMIHYKTNNEVFTTTNFTYSLNEAVKWIKLIGSSGSDVVVVGNFDVVPKSFTLKFPEDGDWYDNVTGQTTHLSTVNYKATLQPGEFHLFSQTALSRNIHHFF